MGRDVLHPRKPVELQVESCFARCRGAMNEKHDVLGAEARHCDRTLVPYVERNA